jgi:hypothetical protein
VSHQQQQQQQPLQQVAQPEGGGWLQQQPAHTSIAVLQAAAAAGHTRGAGFPAPWGRHEQHSPGQHQLQMLPLPPARMHAGHAQHAALAAAVTANTVFASPRQAAAAGVPVVAGDGDADQLERRAGGLKPWLQSLMRRA